MATRNDSRPSSPQLNPLVFIVTGGALVLLVAIALLVQSATGGQPRLTVDKELVDFGQVPVGEKVTATFTLTNTGKGPLVFTDDPKIRAVQGC